MKKMISIVIPVLNEEPNIRTAYDRILESYEFWKEKYDLEIIFTDNCSQDGTYNEVSCIAKDDPRIKIVRFARNVGYQRSILTGYLISSGDAVVQLDCDMQDPPELIEKMIAKWEDGYQVVYGIRRSRKEGLIITGLRKIFYALVDALSSDELPRNVGDFRLVDKRIVSVLDSLKSKSPYLRGQIAASGFNQYGFEYDRDERKEGETKFKFGSLLRLAIDAIVGHSVQPLRLASYVGFLITMIAIFMAFFYLGLWAFSSSTPRGFMTLAILVLFNIGFVSLFLGIIGEYIIRIVEQLTFGPISIIESSINIDSQIIEKRSQILAAQIQESVKK